MFENPAPDEIRALLGKARTIAVVDFRWGWGWSWHRLPEVSRDYVVCASECIPFTSPLLLDQPLAAAPREGRE